MPGLLFLGALSRYFGGSDTILMWAVGGGILSIISLIGAAFVRSRPKAAGGIMLICGFLGLFVALGLWIGALLLMAAGVIALIRKEKPKQPTISPVAQPIYYCTNCGKPLTFMSQSKKWYCESCNTYAPSESQPT